MKYLFRYSVPGIALLLLLGFINITQSDPTRQDGRVADSAEEICPILVGASIPDMHLTTVEGEQFDLNAAISNKPALLIFYRGGWCPFCNVHLAELKTVEDELRQLGYQIIAVSMDRPAKLRESLQEHQLTYTLLSDSTARAAKAFGLAYQVGSETVHRLQDNSMDIEEASGENHNILPVPAAFIVGTDGIIKFEYINPNYKVRIKTDLILAAARAELQSS